MKIGFIVYGLDRPLTGISRYTYELAQALAALPDGAHLTDALQIILLAAGDPGPLRGNPRLPVVNLPGCRLLPGLLTAGNFLLPYLARRLELDVIHDPTGSLPFLFGSAGVPVVATVYDTFTWSIPGYSSSLDTLMHRLWLPRLLSARATRVVTISNTSRGDISRYLNYPEQKIQVIPLGIGEQFRPLPAEWIRTMLAERFALQQPYLLYVGALTRRKNIERALQAFAQLLPEYPDLRFVLTGPRAWQDSPVENVVKTYYLEGKVLLTGPVAEEDLPYLYNGASVFVFPSLYEGFGMPPVEAMACGAPVVTSNVSSLPEVVGEAALQVDPYDVGAIADACRRILSDKALAEDLRCRGLAQARQYTWERTARETVQVYREVIG